MSAPEPFDATFVDLLTPHVPLPGQLFCRVDLTADYGETIEEREITPTITGASLVTSYMAEQSGMHRPVLDLDMPVWDWGSFTEAYGRSVADVERMVAEAKAAAR